MLPKSVRLLFVSNKDRLVNTFAELVSTESFRVLLERFFSSLVCT